jgi:hypothetical protein
MSVAYATPQVRPAPRGPLPEASSGGTWGGLLDAAATDVRLAVAVLDNGWLVSRPALVDAMCAVAELLPATSAAWQALWRGTDGATGPAAALGRRLSSMPDRGSARSESRSAAATLLRTAARSVRSTDDLVATHRQADGSARSPEAALLEDESVLLGGSGVLAGLLSAAAEAGAVVSRQAAAAGVGGAQRRRLLGGLLATRVDAAACRAGVPPLADALARLGVARPAVRGELSADQLADRLRRLRTAAWRLAAGSDVAVGTLADLAACAVELNRSAATYGMRTSQDRVWRELSARLAELRSVQLPSAAVRHDVRAVRWLLRSALPPEKAAPVVASAVGWLPQLAGWSAAAFALLAATDRLYVCGSALRGDEVTDHPDLVAVKLSGRAVLAPYDRVWTITEAYQQAAQP